MRNLLILIMLAVWSVTLAATRSVGTTLKLHQLRSLTANERLKSANQQDKSIQVFISLEDQAQLQSLNDAGITVNGNFGDFVTATLPLNAIDKVTGMKGIKSIAMAQHLTLCNNKAIELSGPTQLTLSDNRHPNNGAGVIVGVIDVGVDFNHINFLDSAGNNRIIAAYLPADTQGAHPVINGAELPGSEYTTPEQISSLTTDTPGESHGTHTTGTAAGGYTGNGYNGVATAADIVICAMPEEELSDVNVANSILYIFNLAERLGKPAVVNMSLGSSWESHDGTSFLCRAIDSLSGAGRICVVSSANEGDKPVHVTKAMRSEGNTLRTFLVNYAGPNTLNGYASIWSYSAKPHTVELAIWDIENDTLVHKLSTPAEYTPDSVYTIATSDDPLFSRYFIGKIEIAAATEDNGYYHTAVMPNLSGLSATAPYRIALLCSAEQGEIIRAWGGGTVVFSNELLYGWSNGSSSGSVSDMATGDRSISVGAYCSANTFTMLNGSTRRYSFSVNELAPFSGYGPDARGISRPDVVAPGAALVSSVSRYRSAYDSPANVVDRVERDGKSYPYTSGYGTSMSAPVVSGAVALWLQMNPELTPEDIKRILKATSTRDEYVDLVGYEQRWGAGKLNIEGGLKLLQRELGGDVNGDGAVNAADVTALYNIILGLSTEYAHRADVNLDSAVNAADVTQSYNTIIGLQ